MTTDRDRRCLVLSLLVAAALAAGACESGPPATDASDEPSSDTTATDTPTDDTTSTETDTTDAGGDADAADPPESVSEQFIHKFPDYTLDPGEETIPCVQWSLDNEKPLYVNSVTMANGGGYHHSNWYVVPESYAAPDSEEESGDGYFDCDERNYRPYTAATQGSVIFAQSTQAKSETQSFPAGVVTKIPPHSKIVADVHFLNIQPREFTTSARMTLGLVHPRDVETIARPIFMTYDALEIPPKSETRFTSECDFADAYSDQTGEKFEMKIYYVLPHYHGLGNYFDLEIFGGPRDGEQIYKLEGFNAEANGKQLEPPMEITDAKGFRFTCGYDNPRDEVVDWGIGGDEMCMMLAFGNQKARMPATVNNTSSTTEKDGIIHKSGPCAAAALPQADGQTMPTEEEKQGEMYIPDSNTDEGIQPVPDCEDRPGTADPIVEPTLTSLETNLFSVGCAFTSCHDSESPASGLDLAADDLHDELMTHELSTPTDKPLVDPGNPEGSWLYQVTSKCKPETNVGPVGHMPKNSPTLLDPGIVAMIREWIAEGAKDN